jgi:hypothetical protein
MTLSFAPKRSFPCGSAKDANFVFRPGDCHFLAKTTGAR